MAVPCHCSWYLLLVAYSDQNILTLVRLNGNLPLEKISLFQLKMNLKPYFERVVRVEPAPNAYVYAYKNYAASIHFDTGAVLLHSCVNFMVYIQKYC